MGCVTSLCPRSPLQQDDEDIRAQAVELQVIQLHESDENADIRRNRPLSRERLPGIINDDISDEVSDEGSVITFTDEYRTCRNSAHEHESVMHECVTKKLPGGRTYEFDTWSRGSQDECETVASGITKSDTSSHFGTCTYNTISEARMAKYDNYWHLKNRAEFLPKLNKITHVPLIDQTRDFEKHIREEVTYLMESILHDWKDNNYQNINEWCDGYEIRPIGSFPCDTKVGDMDEFDYMCVLKVKPDKWTTYKGDDGIWRATKMGYSEINPTFDLCRVIKAHFKKYPGSSFEADQTYSHGPATCMAIMFICHEGHKHKTSIDVSLGIDVKSKELTEDISYRLKMFDRGDPNPFNYVFPFRNHLFVYEDLSQTFVLTSSNYDSHIFDSIQEFRIDARAFFRVLKTMVHTIFPKRVKKRGDCVLSLDEIVSSHACKCFLFEEIAHYPDRKEWTEEKWNDKLHQILKKLITSGDDGAKWRDIVTGQERKIKINTRYFPNALLQNIIGKLPYFDCMEGVVQDHWLVDDAIYFTDSSGYLNRCRSYYPASGPTETLKLLHEEVFAYSLFFTPSALFMQNENIKTLPMIENLTNCFLYRDHAQIDISEMPIADFNHTFGLVFGRTLLQHIHRNCTSGKLYDTFKMLRYMLDFLVRQQLIFGRVESDEDFESMLWRGYFEGATHSYPVDILGEASLPDLKQIAWLGAFNFSHKLPLGLHIKVVEEFLSFDNEKMNTFKAWLMGERNADMGAHCLYLSIHHILNHRDVELVSEVFDESNDEANFPVLFFLSPKSEKYLSCNVACHQHLKCKTT